MSHTRSMPALVAASTAALVTLVATAGPARAEFAERFPGGRYDHIVANGQDYHLLLVDLCAPGLSVRGTRPDEKGRVVSNFGGLVGAAAAINGDFFGGGFGTDGPAMGNGERWGGNDHTYVAPVAFGRFAVEVPHHGNEGGPPPWAEQVVSGHPTLLDDGAVVGNPGDPLCTNRHPRTALGISADHRTLLLLVVDGRRGGAAGMTCPDMAGVMTTHGMFDAVALDGGGSSTMWLANGGVMNRPSDGNERTVGNHLAIIASGAGGAPQCPTPEYRAEFVSQSHPQAHVGALELHVGETATGFMELRNTGSAAWNGQTKLAPIPRDAPSPLHADTWIEQHRVSSVAQATAPGEVGRFQLDLKGGAVGEYTLKLGLVQEGVAWFADNGGPSDDLLTVKANVLPAVPDAASPPNAGVDVDAAMLAEDDRDLLTDTSAAQASDDGGESMSGVIDALRPGPRAEAGSPGGPAGSAEDSTDPRADYRGDGCTLAEGAARACRSGSGVFALALGASVFARRRRRFARDRPTAPAAGTRWR